MGRAAPRLFERNSHSDGISNHGAGVHADILQYPLWIEQAVPLFLLVQVFHAYKKEIVSYPIP